MAVQLAMTVRKETRHRTTNLRPERSAIRRQVAAPLAPPARGAAPEQLLAALGALLHLETFACQRGARLSKRRHHPLPPGLAFAGRLIDGFVQTPVMFNPPVPEQVLVGAFPDLHDRGAAVLHELGEEIQR